MSRSTPAARSHARSIEERTTAVFSALSDPTRRRILLRLAQGPATAGELAEPFDISLPAISKHLRVLESAGLMRREIEGRQHHCALDTEALNTASGFIDEMRSFWEQNLDQLAEYVEAQEPSPTRRRK